MTDSPSSKLKQCLGEFVLPQTGRPLGGPGSTFEVEQRGAGLQVAIRLGFPMARSSAPLIEALRVHCGPVLAGTAVDFSVTTSIVAHAVQHGLKPLPGAHNLVAVASGKGGVGKSTVAV